MSFGAAVRDPGVFAVVVGGLMLVALLTCWLPARAAARVNPVKTLAAE